MFSIFFFLLNVIRTCYFSFSFGGLKCVCLFCDVVMWYEERVDVSKETQNPTFSLCCEQGIVRLLFCRKTL